MSPGDGAFDAARLESPFEVWSRLRETEPDDIPRGSGDNSPSSVWMRLAARYPDELHTAAVGMILITIIIEHEGTRGAPPMTLDGAAATIEEHNPTAARIPDISRHIAQLVDDGLLRTTAAARGVCLSFGHKIADIIHQQGAEQ